MKLPRKLKKRIKKESLKQERLNAVMYAIQAFRIQISKTSTKSKFPLGGIINSGEEYLYKPEKRKCQVLPGIS